MEHRQEIEHWHVDLELEQRLKLNHPQPVLRAWKATQAKDDDTKPKKSKLKQLQEQVQKLTTKMRD